MLRRSRAGRPEPRASQRSEETEGESGSNRKDTSITGSGNIGGMDGYARSRVAGRVRRWKEVELFLRGRFHNNLVLSRPRNRETFCSASDEAALIIRLCPNQIHRVQSTDYDCLLPMEHNIREIASHIFEARRVANDLLPILIH